MLHFPYLPLELAIVAAAVSFDNTSVGTLVLAALVAVGQWWQNRKIKEVHIIVNSQKTAMQKEIDSQGGQIEALQAQLGIAKAAPAEEV